MDAIGKKKRMKKCWPLSGARVAPVTLSGSLVKCFILLQAGGGGDRDGTTYTYIYIFFTCVSLVFYRPSIHSFVPRSMLSRLRDIFFCAPFTCSLF